MSSGRLQAFSDGVLAIVITLLILDTKVPADARGHLGRDLADQWSQYAAYLSAFLVVVIIWLNHHATLQLLARTDHRNQVLNLLPLLPVSSCPGRPPCSRSTHGTSPWPTSASPCCSCGVTSSAITLTFTVLWRYLLLFLVLMLGLALACLLPTPDLHTETTAV